LSHWASAIAVRSVTYGLAKELDSGKHLTREMVKTNIMTATADIHSLEQRCRSAGLPVNTHDFACTCIIAAVQSTRLVVAQIGDGAVVANVDGGLRCLSRAPDREYVNETTFLNSANAFKELDIRDEDTASISAIAIMTDGVQDGVQHLAIRYPMNEPYDGFFQPLFDYARQNLQNAEAERNRELAEFLDTPGINAETDDDKTLLIAVRGS
jgi:hypothetical protein